MRFFLRHMRANRDGMLVMLVIQGGLFLLGVLIVLGINAGLNDERDYAAIGSMMALMGTAFGSLARGHGAPVRYRMAVSMGCPRRFYLLADPLVTALNTLAGVVTAWVLNKLELWFYSVLYRGWELDSNTFTVIEWWTAEWWVWIVFIGGVCAVDFCLGALQLRYGAKGFALVWFPLCFGPGVITNSVQAMQRGSTSLLARLGEGVVFVAGLLSPAAWGGVGAAAVLAAVAFSARCYLRAEVRM